MTRTLSKSKFLVGQQCAKLLWTHYNAKKDLPPPDDATQAIFDQGHVVGALAQTLFPGGIEIGGDPKDIEGALRQTQELVPKRKPLFEPAFQHGSAFARADILNPVARGAWDIVEVKSSTSVKEVNVLDLALQRYTYEGAGLTIRKCILMHIDKEYVRDGEIDATKLFVQQDVTADVAQILPKVADDLAAMVKVIARKTVPQVAIGPHCDDPYECALKERCWAFLPEDNPLTLYRIRKDKAFELIDRGITSITKLPRDVKLNDKQRIQVGSAQKGRAFADPKAIGRFLDDLVYPLWFLDFETIAPGVPLFDGSRPFQNIPFQFSLHVQDSPGAPPRHVSFLAEGRDDPRPRFLKELRAALGDRLEHGPAAVGSEAGRTVIRRTVRTLVPAYLPVSGPTPFTMLPQRPTCVKSVRSAQAMFCPSCGITAPAHLRQRNSGMKRLLAESKYSPCPRTLNSTPAGRTLTSLVPAAVGGNAAYAGDVLHFAAGGLDMNAGHGAEQVGEILWRDFGNIILAQRIDRIGHIKAAFGAGGHAFDLFLNAVSPRGPMTDSFLDATVKPAKARRSTSSSPATRLLRWSGRSSRRTRPARSSRRPGRVRRRSRRRSRSHRSRSHRLRLRLPFGRPPRSR